MIRYRSYNNEVVFIIVEGKSEKAIIDILLDNDCLLFARDNLFESRILSGLYRDPKRVVEIIRGKKFENKILLVYVLDSKKEAKDFEKIINKELNHIVDTNTVLTRPEIEILFIISKNDYYNFKNKNFNKLKASEYCKVKYKEKNIKSEEFIKSYFNDYKKLLDVIKKYNQFTRNNDLNLYDLLREECKTNTN